MLVASWEKTSGGIELKLLIKLIGVSVINESWLIGF